VTLSSIVFPRRTKRETRIASNDLGSLIYGQLVTGEQAYFARHGYSHHRIEVRELPHFRFWYERGERTAGEALYDQFLACTVNDRLRREELREQYRSLYEDVKARGVTDPIRVSTAPDGRLILLDGTRRTCVAYALGMDVPSIEVPFRDALLGIVENKEEFYGTRNASRPYQSIFYKNRELIPGRRRDIIERFQKIDIAQDIRGRDVLDIGCNIGINAMTAWYFGAASVTGMEFSPRIADAAVRLSVFLDSRIRVVVQDLGQRVDAPRQFDTVLCFSLYRHVADHAMLEQNIVDLTARTLYFEGHENGRKVDYEHIFRHFSTVEQIGFNRDGIHSNASTRPFFRCRR
jgi:hypothetical protein